MIGKTMSGSNKIIGALLVVGIVLLYINYSTRWRSEDLVQYQAVDQATGMHQQADFSQSTLDVIIGTSHDLRPLPSDLPKKNTTAEAAEKALIEKVKTSMLPPAVQSDPIKNSKAISTYFSQEQQDQLVVNMTRKKVNGIFFEAGALDGERYSNTLHLERALGWTGLLVEPSKKSFDRLKQKGRRARILNACLSPNLEAAEMLFDDMNNELIAMLASDQSKKTNRTEMVSCYPLYTMLKAMDVPIIDFLSLDIEGNELKVLNTVPWERVKVRIMGVEIIHIVPEGPEAVRVFLEKKGFVFYKQQGADYFFYHPDYASELDLS